METQTSHSSSKSVLIIIALGIWALVLQNAGIIPTAQYVNVANTVDANVLGGNIEANVSGSVNVDNTVDINVEQINGSSAVFYRDTDGQYNLIGVTSR